MGLAKIQEGAGQDVSSRPVVWQVPAGVKRVQYIFYILYFIIHLRLTIKIIVSAVAGLACSLKKGERKEGEGDLVVQGLKTG